MPTSQNRLLMSTDVCLQTKFALTHCSPDHYHLSGEQEHIGRDRYKEDYAHIGVGREEGNIKP